MKYKYRLISAFVLVTLAMSNHALATNNDKSESLIFNELATTCASNVDSSTLQAIVRTESAFNPYAIGVVRGSIKQPTTFEEAVAAAKKLEAEGKNFSMGLAQINRYNLAKYNLDYESVFDVCNNLKAGAEILAECYGRAPGKQGQEALQEALSCYYSGNFRTGFGNDLKGLPSYVERILTSAKQNQPDQRIKKPVEHPSTKPTVTNVPAIDANVKPVKAIVRASSSINKGVEKKPVSLNKVSQNETASLSPAAWDAFGEW